MKIKGFRFFANEDFHRIFILFLAVVITFLVVISAYPYKKYDYEVLDIAEVDIKAPYDIENTFLTENDAKTNKDKTEPIVIDKKNQVTKSISIVNAFFSFIYDLRILYSSEALYKSDTYDRTYDEFSVWLNENSVEMLKNQIDYLVTELSEDEYLRFLSVTFEIVTLTMEKNIMQNDLSENILEAQNSYRQKGLSQETVSAGQSFISSVIFINREIDEYLSSEVKDKVYYLTLQTQNEIIKKGDIIVRSGLVITPEIYDIMLKGNLIREKGLKGYLTYLMILFYLVALYIFILIYLKYFYKKAYRGRKEELMLFLIIILVLVLSRSALVISPILIPLYIAPMLIAILLELKLAIIFNIMLTCVVAIFVPQVEMIFTLFLGGAFGAILVQNQKLRSRLSLSGIFAAMIAALIYIVSSMIHSYDIMDALKNSLFVLIAGTFSIVITVGLLPLFETIFNVITPNKLLELSNPNQPLLKRLLLEAPGTYHHSLMVGNLAEEATDKIGGNSLLARVGAYYHDIGKIQRPQYFFENQKGENPHDEMNPKLSSFVLVSHVTDGVKLAKEVKLPIHIIDFINTHHGNALTSYFFLKAKETETTKKVAETDYRYTGPRPFTKEGGVVMLADSVEAAVKSLEDKCDDNIESCIRKIIKEKLDDGQLENCDLTLKDINIITKSFSNVISGYYHKRVAYPEIPEREEE